MTGRALSVGGGTRTAGEPPPFHRVMMNGMTIKRVAQICWNYIGNAGALNGGFSR